MPMLPLLPAGPGVDRLCRGLWDRTGPNPAQLPACPLTAWAACEVALFAVFTGRLGNFRIDETHQCAREAGDAYKHIICPLRTCRRPNLCWGSGR
jgi:hypothetical protein